MHLCSSISWTDGCTRSYFETLPSLLLVIILICLAIPFVRRINWPIQELLTLPEAEAILHPKASSSHTSNINELHISKRCKPALWCTLCLSGFALAELVSWISIFSYRIVIHGSLDHRTIPSFVNAIVWLPATVLPVSRPMATSPYDLFTLYIFQFVAGVFRLGAIWYDMNIAGASMHIWDVVGSVINLIILLALLLIVLCMPIGIPSNEDTAKNIGKSVSPEDYTPLWGWISFEWVWPLISLGTKQTLNDTDVWELSPLMRSKAVYVKFSTTRGKSLLLRLLAANAFDLTMDFVLTIVTVVLSFSGPFFLKRILDAIDPSQSPEPENRSRAFIYAFLAFLATLCKAVTDCIHLWYGRRASARVKSSLMATIQAKVLVRKDYSGTVDEKEGKGGKGKTVDGKSVQNGQTAKAPKKEDKKADHVSTAGADVGKIVNLLGGDVNRVIRMVAALFQLYFYPLQLVISFVFLYQLLGFSTLVGFASSFVLSPLNSFIAGRTTGIRKGFLAARDKRMSILNELLNAVKLVKFYGWENRWIEQVIDARNVELQWLVKSRINQIILSMLWMNGTIMVSVVTFFTFILTGHELSIPVAFTAISLFIMLRAPLSILPNLIVQVKQTRVSIDRISAFLNEDEVPADFSNLKQDAVHRAAPIDYQLGIENASFRWNKLVDEDKKKIPQNISSSLPKSSASSITGGDDSAPSDSVSVVEENGDEQMFELKDISVIFPDGKLTLVTGPTASGKTALLMALLGEMSMLPGNGKIHLSKGRFHPDENGYAGVSYAGQVPFLQHQTIRQNILFGAPYEEARYQNVVEACALKPDLEIFEDGDMTEIGSRGISLSGGQKARVALARAVYSRSKCVLLDDPLSAVDSHTALFLYERLLKGPLLAHRTVVLVTHNVELVLEGAHYLVRLLDGRIDVQGTTEELREKDVLDAIKESSAEKFSEDISTAPKDAQDANKPVVLTASKIPRKLVEDENRETGSVKWRIYNTYLKATTYWTWILLSVGIAAHQLTVVGEKLWIKQWGEAYDDTNIGILALYSNTLSTVQIYTATDYVSPLHPSNPFSDFFTSRLPSASQHPLFYVGIYAAITFGAAAISIVNIIIQYVGGLRASKVLFKRLLTSVVGATMRWHDSTPTGRMLNRFSQDTETIDTDLGTCIQSVTNHVATLSISILTIVFFTPPFIFPAIVIGYVYYILGIGYLNTGRDLRRMEANSRSPIISSFSELLIGIVTVRAFSSERRLLDSLHEKIDTATKMWYSFWMINRWLLLHFDVLGGLTILFTTLLALSGAIGAGLAGLTITSAMSFNTAIYWATRFWTELELALNSVERVVEYSELPQDPPLLIESNRPPAHWPSSSENETLVCVENLVVRYSPELPAVLQGVSFHLKARERVGLLGRTGSGKSTLAMSLLRFTEPSSGRILIDGIDISTIGLHDLRSRLTFVAQDAVLFSGSIRDNIDPFGDYSDKECLDALSRVHLLEGKDDYSPSTRPSSREASINEMEQEGTTAASSTVASHTASGSSKQQGKISLESQVSAGGANFSQGQRQLLTMARALLRQSSIIILDEATSSIDYATDAKIQAAIREEFNHSLLITVAHRLRTIIDYDRLIILDNGRVLESDTPYNLINQEGSAFRDMCKNSGAFEELEASANKVMVERRV